MTRLLLDSSAYIAFKKRHPEAIDILQQAELIFLSPIVLGELRAAFSKGRNVTPMSANCDFFWNPRASGCWSWM